MKGFERIFLYSVLAILVFYVFLVDGNVESQVVIQEEIKARSIVIVNDAGQGVIKLLANENGGVVAIGNNSGNLVASIGTSGYSGVVSLSNKDGNAAVYMGADENGGLIGIINKYNVSVAGIRVTEDDSGIIGVLNKNNEVIGTLP